MSANVIFQNFYSSALQQEELFLLDIKLIDLLCEDNFQNDIELHLILALLCRRMRQGSLRLALQTETCLSELNLYLKFLAMEKYSADMIFFGFQEKLHAGNYVTILGQAHEFKPLIYEDQALYFQKYFAAENKSAQALATLLQKSDYTFPLTKPLSALLDILLIQFPLRKKDSANQPLVFHPLQIEALTQSLIKPFFLISGGPGTGKTALTTNILRGVLRSRHLKPERIKLAAPTGRAADRLSEALQQGLTSIDYNRENGAQEKAIDAQLLELKGETLHRLLRFNRQEGSFIYNKLNPIPADLVIIDEASMANIFLMSRLLNALPPSAALILVGDRDQLPSIEAGALLADLLPNSEKSLLENHILRLNQSHRSNAQILQVAAAINSQDIAAVLFNLGIEKEIKEAIFLAEGCIRLAASTSFKTSRDTLLQAWSNVHYLASSTYLTVLNSIKKYNVSQLSEQNLPLQDLIQQAFDFISKPRLLTFTRKLWCGSEAINAWMQMRLRKIWDPSSEAKYYFNGAPILILENDYTQGLFNGDFGIILQFAENYFALFKKGNTIISLPIHSLPAFEFAFAMTVHKSQGSEFDYVVLILPEAEHPLLCKEILYTGITRAKKFVGIFGPEEALKSALKQKIQRESGLYKRLITKIELLNS